MLDPSGVGALSGNALAQRLAQLQIEEAACNREWAMTAYELNRRYGGDHSPSASSVGRHREVAQPQYLRDLRRANAVLTLLSDLSSVVSTPVD
ncbi:hypothetical protein ACHAQH_003972, partial [Verticillium albo-atrum]